MKTRIPCWANSLAKLLTYSPPSGKVGPGRFAGRVGGWLHKLKKIQFFRKSELGLSISLCGETTMGTAAVDLTQERGSKDVNPTRAVLGNPGRNSVQSPRVEKNARWKKAAGQHTPSSPHRPFVKFSSRVDGGRRGSREQKKSLLAGSQFAAGLDLSPPSPIPSPSPGILRGKNNP